MFFREERVVGQDKGGGEGGDDKEKIEDDTAQRYLVNDRYTFS